ncbi:putative GNAT family acetyltransferase [Xylaria arbuscula]|nr:putative GNAT family acetyltransferase [Xylaria arbuscula]
MTAAFNQLHMRVATRQDAHRIAEIHMAAFAHNAMLHAQFPTPAIRKALQSCIANKALADIRDPKTTVLVVVASEDRNETVETIIAFAKWSHPALPGEDYVEAPWIWPEGTDLGTLQAWTARAAEAESRSIGDTPCYHLSFIGTDPLYAQRGAGHLLVQWGIEQSIASGSPLYLESTLEAVAFYKREGFIAGETISLPIHVDGGAEEQLYEEIVFTYRPA